MEKLLAYWSKLDKNLLPTLFAVLSALGIVILFLLSYNQLPPRLPLFYSLHWGESQLITKQQFLLLPTTLIIITFINTLITLQLHPIQDTLKKMLMLNLVLISLIITVTAIKILNIFI